MALVTWKRDIAHALALHDLATAGHALVPSHAPIATARVGVVAAIDRAMAAGVPEADIDVVLGAWSLGAPDAEAL